jgi:hypothetical protein
MTKNFKILQLEKIHIFLDKKKLPFILALGPSWVSTSKLQEIPSALKRKYLEL